MLDPVQANTDLWDGKEKLAAVSVLLNPNIYYRREKLVHLLCKAVS